MYNFPNTPVLGQIFTPSNGPTYVWDGYAWRAVGPGAPATLRVSDTPPPAPALGQLWWESDTGRLFIWYNDINSAQWVQISGPVGLPGPQGDMGPVGPQGEQGEQGIQGIPGDTAPSYLRWACSDETTPIVASNAKVTDRMPHVFTLTGVRASLNIAQATGALFTVNLKWWNGSAYVSALSTLLTFDNTELTSVTAAIQPVISKTAFASDDLVRINVTQIGDGIAAGLKVTLLGTSP